MSYMVYGQQDIDEFENEIENDFWKDGHHKVRLEMADKTKHEPG